MYIGKIVHHKNHDLLEYVSRASMNQDRYVIAV